MACKTYIISTTTPMNGLYLQDQQVQSIISGEKKLLINTSVLSDFVGEELFLLAKNKIHGIVKLDPFNIVDGKSFDALYDKHLVTPTQRKKWWPNIDTFHLYTITVIKKIKPTIFWKIHKNPGTFIKNVDVEEAVTIKIPITQLTKKRLELLSPAEQQGVYKRINTIATYVDPKQAKKFRKIADTIYSKSKQLPYILQMEFSSIDQIDHDLNSDGLIEKFYPYHFNLRLQKNDQIMVGWTLHTLEISKLMTAVEKEEHDASIWHKVASFPSYTVLMEPEQKIIKYFTIDTGTYTVIKINENVYQYVFDGKKLHGTYICSKRATATNWTMERIE